MNDENIVRGVGGESNEIENHRHCQATVLSAYGPTGDGKTKDEIDDLVLGNLRQDWKDNFLNNRNNITEDLAGILKVMNANFGDVLKQLALGESSIDKLNQGKSIVLTLTTGDGDKTLKFNTIKPNDGSEVYQVDISTTSDLKAGDGLTRSGNTISLLKASNTQFGGIKIGSGLTINDGVLSSEPSGVPIMTNDEPGIAKCGVGLEVKNKALNVNYGSGLTIDSKTGKLCAIPGSVPIMTKDEPGIAKVGDGLDVDGDGKLSVSGIKKIVAGSNVTISPESGIGEVIISASGGGGGGEGGNFAAPLLTPFWEDHTLDSKSFVLSDGEWKDGSTYTLIYQHLVDDWNGGTTKTEIVSGISIDYRLSPDGHKLIQSSNETKYTQLFDTCGVAWYYVIDIENKRFKLPRTKYGLQGIKDTVGKFDEQGLPIPSISTSGLSCSSDGSHSHTYTAPNGTGTAPSYDGVRANVQGTTSKTTGSDGSHTHTISGTVSVSSSDPIYKSDNKVVQPPATEMYLYFATGISESKIVDDSPVGTIIAFSSSKNPDGYLPCDGRALNKADYMDLFNAIEYIYGGSGDTFNLPTLNDGRYLRGDSTITGTKVDAGLPNINATATLSNLTTSSAGEHSHYYSGFYGSGYGAAFSNAGIIPATLETDDQGGHTHTISGTGTIKVENQGVYGLSDTVTPKSLAVRYLIKYKPTQVVDRVTVDDIYPVGSLYFGTGDVCPLQALISGSEWNLVGSKIITGIESSITISGTAKCKGDGKALGVKCYGYSDISGSNPGIKELGLIGYTNAAAPTYNALAVTTDALNTNIDSTQRGIGSAIVDATSMGITDNASNSGIVCDLSTATTTGEVTHESISINIWKRIK